MTTKQLEQASGAIIMSFINLHFLEEANASGMFRQRVKQNVKRTMEDLLEIEDKYFSAIEQVDEANLGDKLTANSLEFIKLLLNKFTFNDFTKMQEIAAAYAIDPKAVSRLSDKILYNSQQKL